MNDSKTRKVIFLTVCIYLASLISQRSKVIYKGSDLLDRKLFTQLKNGTCFIPDLVNFNQFYAYLEKSKEDCIKKEKVGGNNGDGHKWVCFDKGFKPGECIIYSFGIANEWSFDDAMDQHRNCQVFSFDPTIGAKDHRRSQRISFFNIGISNYEGYVSINQRNCSVYRYRGIVNKLGHANKIVDYLKMDVEGSEILFFKDILDNDLELLDNIQQIGLEIHPGYPDKINIKFKDYWEIFHRLECLGWRLMNMEINPIPPNPFRYMGTTRSHCYEMVWIKS